ncbi:hypothetical protein LR48_Vigan07g132500 [Vigna angularis]|uniref:Uncharacterized protein n=1 Tax=Phaseolus angularis TaxID=3914 RepID=A0A0L9UY48_PHAAN|nr:hypothetical protein LR48_Vigan07g132500 [Vigna angularis]
MKKEVTTSSTLMLTAQRKEQHPWRCVLGEKGRCSSGWCPMRKSPSRSSQQLPPRRGNPVAHHTDSMKKKGDVKQFAAHLHGPCASSYLHAPTISTRAAHRN